MAQGALSFSQVRALTRVARAENEEDLLELTEGYTTAQLERVVRGWRRGSRRDEAQRERERHERRTFSVFPDEDGMYVVQGRLEPEVAAVLMRAVEAAADALYRRDRDGSAGGSAPIADRLRPEEETRKAAAQRRADAVGLLAERALAAGFGAAEEEEEGDEDVPVSGTRAQRFQVLLHVEEATLRGDDAAAGAAGRASAETSGRADPAAGPGPRAHLEDGTRVSAETSRRLACDAAVARITHRPDGSVLDVGRRRRTIPPALRRALEARDGGCRFPGCGLRFTDAHHVRHWADGGETSLGNTLLLCRHHHRLVHEEGWRVAWWGQGRPVFIDPRGGEHFDGRWADRPGGSAPTGSVEALVGENLRAGVEPDWRTAGARWKRLEDVPREVLLRGLEAMG
jgi:hypothetical protein